MGQAARDHAERLIGARLLYDAGIRGYPYEELVAVLRRGDLRVERIDRHKTLGSVASRALSRL